MNPASDGAIALAMAHVIVAEGLADEGFWRRWANLPFEDLPELLAPYTPAFAEAESGVPAQDIRRLAIEFAEAAPACCTLSNRGSAKHYNGVQADRAIRMLDVLVGNVGKPGGFCLSTLRMWKERYGQEGLPVIDQPEPRPKGPKPWKPGTREFETLPEDVKARVAAFPEAWQDKYFGELATPSEYPLSWHWYGMRVGQMVYPYIREGRQEVGVYMSFTLGAAYGFPEANLAREVLADESLIPFHVAIDVSYGEQAALADIILPDATALERWDAHSTNSYGLRPYTGIRQPLVEPRGEARPAQWIWQQLAKRIGGGMERYFEFDDLEDYYRAWYQELPVDWEDFKRDGIWQDPERPLDYELYERELSAEELEGTETDPETGLVYRGSGGEAEGGGDRARWPGGARLRHADADHHGRGSHLPARGRKDRPPARRPERAGPAPLLPRAGARGISARTNTSSPPSSGTSTPRAARHVLGPGGGDRPHEPRLDGAGDGGEARRGDRRLGRDHDLPPQGPHLPGRRRRARGRTAKPRSGRAGPAPTRHLLFAPCWPLGARHDRPGGQVPPATSPAGAAIGGSASRRTSGGPVSAAVWATGSR